MTTPALPWSIALDSFVTHFIPDGAGGMFLVFTPAIAGADGRPAFIAPQVRVRLSADGWRLFQRHVAADGELPALHIAGQVPPGPLPG